MTETSSSGRQGRFAQDTAAYEALNHILAHVNGPSPFAPQKPARMPNRHMDEIQIWTSAKRSRATWLTAAPGGFYGQTIRVHVPDNKAMVVQLYHALAEGDPCEYSATIEGGAFPPDTTLADFFETGSQAPQARCIYQPMWMFGREIGYLLGWEHNSAGQALSMVRLLLSNPQHPNAPLVIEMVRGEAEPPIVIVREREDSRLVVEEIRQ